ncbi:hypothetical protein V565_077990 [Rhizoctonia solani 123E]|uniref:Uncharacterized protein n=1 Tax=Rhizoctonia solani 123E TaxID=1423351 RepID=A0A074RTV2_9AGAM|nr:hypothetical protein V565_077990 [Rhizoctonia solani 123E]
MMKRSAPAISMPENQDAHVGPGETDANNSTINPTFPGSTPSQVIQSTETQHPPLEEPSPSHETTDHENPRETHEHHGPTEFMAQIQNKLEDISRILVGTQNSLARGFNSSTIQGRSGCTGFGHNLGAHSLINAHGEVPETYDLPTFTLTNSGFYGRVVFSIDKLTENILARYLRFYSIGEEMIEEGEELKIKSGMLDDAKRLLSERLFLNR